MTLVAVEGVLEAVAKVADDSMAGADELVRLGLYEALADGIDQVRDELDAGALSVMSERNATARSALLRVSVGKSLQGEDEDYTEVAGYLGLLDEYVEKSLSSGLMAMFNRQHPRGPDGRFVRQDLGHNTSPNQGLPERQTSRMSEAHRHVRQWKQTGLADDNSAVVLHYGRADANGKVGTAENTVESTVGQLNDAMQGHAASEPDAVLMGISLDRRGIPGDNAKQRAALDAMMTFTGAGGAAAAAPLVRGLTRPDTNERIGGAAEDWNRPSQGGDRQAYRRLSLTGSALAGVSAPGSAANTIGHLARLVGDLGPEAEKVLAPGIRRTAYRYRGTERRPDRGMEQDLTAADTWAAGLSGKQRDEAIAQLNAGASRRGGELPTAAAVAAAYVAPKYAKWDEDQLALGIRGDVAAADLLDEVPDEDLTRISIAAGELPPSQGVIIDADGNLVSHAQGYNGDHYLPFDLRNLKALQGGQYVRTRAAGGLTTEDIYTGLLTGARQVQVISNSGVFTLELDPDLRGGRRYTDKARRMVERYGRLVEAIDSGKLFSQDVDRAKQAELRRQAFEHTGWDAEEGQARFTQLLDRARAEGSIDQDDAEDLLWEKAKSEIAEYDANQRGAGRDGLSRQGHARQVEDRFNEMLREARSTRVRRYMLDGQGYAAAMKTLQQEFPFFIRDARYERLPEFVANRRIRTDRELGAGTARDRGHVEMGQTNPTAIAARTGRLVPTGRSSRTAEPQGQRQPAPTPAAQSQTPAQPRPVSASVAHEGQVTSPVAEGTRALADFVSPTGPGFRQLRGIVEGVGKLTSAYSEELPQSPSGSTLKDIEGDSPEQFVHALWNSPDVGMAGDSTKIAEYLTKNPAAQAKYIEGLNRIETRFAAVSDQYPTLDSDMDTRLGGKSMGDVTESARALLQMKEPFAAVEEGKPLAKPPLLQGIVALGDKPENYAKFEESAKTDEPPLANAISDLRGRSHDAQASAVNRMFDAAADAKYKNEPADQVKDLSDRAMYLARAWAFLTGERLAEEVSGGPKESAAKRLSPDNVTPALRQLRERVRQLSDL
jgi:hypothetical protein